MISKEPLGPVVRHGDDEWGDVVRWTLYAMVEAEELGVSSGQRRRHEGQRDQPERPPPARRRGRAWAQDLGLPNDWAYKVVKQVGNYGEIFERNVGKSTPLKIERGLNALWKDGGLQYAMPVR